MLCHQTSGQRTGGCRVGLGSVCHRQSQKLTANPPAGLHEGHGRAKRRYMPKGVAARTGSSIRECVQFLDNVVVCLRLRFRLPVFIQALCFSRSTLGSDRPHVRTLEAKAFAPATHHGEITLSSADGFRWSTWCMIRRHGNQACYVPAESIDHNCEEL